MGTFSSRHLIWIKFSNLKHKAEWFVSALQPQPDLTSLQQIALPLQLLDDA